MKAEIKDAEVPVSWKPITVELTLESVEEARLLFHCVNRVGLLKTLQLNLPNSGYRWDDYSQEISPRFGITSSFLADEITRQGFKL